MEVICSYLTICSCLKRRALKCWVTSLRLQLWFMDSDLNSRVIWLGCFLGAISDTNIFRSFILGCLNSSEKNLPISCVVVSILRAGVGKMAKVLHKQHETFHLALLPTPCPLCFGDPWSREPTFYFIFFQRINPSFLSEVEEMRGGLLNRLSNFPSSWVLTLIPTSRNFQSNKQVSL